MYMDGGVGVDVCVLVEVGMWGEWGGLVGAQGKISISDISTVAHKTSLDLDASRTDLDRISRRSRGDLIRISPRSRRSLTGSHTALTDLAAPRHKRNWSQHARDVEGVTLA